MQTSVMVFYTLTHLATLLILLTQECHSQLNGSRNVSTVCGKAPLNNRIIGGQAASPGRWPWQVSLQVSGKHICGGSLINDQWVLTAAQCLSSYGATSVTAVLGLQTLSGSSQNSQSVKIHKTIVHPSYNSYAVGDICLLELATPVYFTDYIQPVCLAASGSTFYSGTDTWVTGWGTTSAQSLVMSRNLREVEIPIIGNRQCKCIYGMSTITNNMMCAGQSEGGQDFCMGDEGGPMVIKQGDQWIQIGIPSFGIGCGMPDFPGVYTRVSQYQSWIHSHITSNQPGFIPFTSTGTDSDLSVSCSGLPPPPTKRPPPTTPKPVFCGQAPRNTRMSGGNSTAGMWPWMVSLQRNGSHMCAGTLVSVDSVLSNADCFSSLNNPSDWTAVLRHVEQNGSDPIGVTFRVTKISLSNITESNIAVLGLGDNPTLSDYVQPICLDPGRTFTVGSACWAAGWRSEQGGVLQESQTTLVDCGNTSSTSICTGRITLEQGDSGGPIMCKQDGAWFQAAVLRVTTTNSTNQTTAEPMLVFNKLSVYDNFLAQTIGTFLSPASSSNSSSSSNTTSSTTAATKTSSMTTRGGTAAPLPFFILQVLVLFICLYFFS